MSTNFKSRHIGPRSEQIQEMLEELGFKDLEEMSNSVIPKDILSDKNLNPFPSLSEVSVLEKLRKLVNENKKTKSFIGMGYYGTYTPAVIQRNILENPGWYTQYTPYQAEISQGRLEALLNYQTMVSDLTGLALSNASLLDEATAAAEAMVMFFNSTKVNSKSTFLVSSSCHPQTVDVLKTRAEPFNIKLKVIDISDSDFEDNVFGALLQYPDTNGRIDDYSEHCNN